jgi:3-oxoacyl-[acyl-carrier protein] reductase
MIRYDLTGKTALVTGGASGIGFATAKMLAGFGATVAVNFLRDDTRGPEAVDKINALANASGRPGTPGNNVPGGKAVMAPGSVSDARDAVRMVEQAVTDLGRLDLLVNNAGTPGTRHRIAPPDLDLITEDLWSTLLETNLLGVFRCAKAAAPALKQAGGAIVNTASIAGLGRAGSSLAYGATKAGVVSLTQNLARALAPEVRVNAIAPGAVDSSWMVEWTNEERQQSIERALLKRRCQPEDLAEVIVFLGFGAAMVTGQTVTVDGGLTL